jgi:hypothetical protein
LQQPGLGILILVLDLTEEWSFFDVDRKIVSSSKDS